MLVSLALEGKQQLGLPLWLAWDLREVGKGGTGNTLYLGNKGMVDWERFCFRFICSAFFCVERKTRPPYDVRR
jgi:hypothetical protein